MTCCSAKFTAFVHLALNVLDDGEHLVCLCKSLLGDERMRLLCCTLTCLLVSMSVDRQTTSDLKEDDISVVLSDLEFHGVEALPFLR